jgi:hypothetical protein
LGFGERVASRRATGNTKKHRGSWEEACPGAAAGGSPLMHSVIDRQRNDTISKIVSVVSIAVDSV